LRLRFFNDHFHAITADEFHLVLSGEKAAQVEGKPDHVMKLGDKRTCAIYSITSSRPIAE
jgi:hypothetical protein